MYTWATKLQEECHKINWGRTIESCAMAMEETIIEDCKGLGMNFDRHYSNVIDILKHWNLYSNTDDKQRDTETKKINVYSLPNILGDVLYAKIIQFW